MFHKKDGGVVQLIDKEDMEEWPVELPLIFIEYIRNNKLDTYEDPKIKKDIEKYLDEILTDVAIPRMIEVLDGEKTDEIEQTLQRIDELAKKKLDLVKPLKPYIEKLEEKGKNDVKKLTSSILTAFVKEERKKVLAEKRKHMQEMEQQFLEGKVSPEDYAKARKEYLLLKD
jgi:valyl-tRNA synthetase